MKILFFCGSAEPGKDGVGDYTRRLCGELLRLNISAQIVSLCDKDVIYFKLEIQIVDENAVVVNRIPLSTSNRQRYIYLQNIVNFFDPDLISIQYVPYSFNRKGIPFWLPSFLSKLKGQHKWHIMFHELWLGIDLESSFKHKCVGQLQQLIVKKIIKNVNPYQINTQNKLYQFHLLTINIVADILPIFGNIPVSGIKYELKKNTQFILFGTIHHGAPFEDFISDLVLQKAGFSDPIQFVFIGKNGPELSNYKCILEHYRISYEVLGIQSEEVISEVLLNSDYGISTTPYFQTEKSGVYAAYREHQLSTICVSRKWTPKYGDYIIPNIIKYEKTNLNLKPKNLDILDLSYITKQFLNSIS